MRPERVSWLQYPVSLVLHACSILLPLHNTACPCGQLKVQGQTSTLTTEHREVPGAAHVSSLLAVPLSGQVSTRPVVHPL